MKVLGPIASYQEVAGVDPTNMFYVDLTDVRLADGETVTAAYVTTTTTGITVSNVGYNTAAFVNDDGITVAIGKAVKWRVTVTESMVAIVVFKVTYTTSDDNADTIDAELLVKRVVA